MVFWTAGQEQGVLEGQKICTDGPALNGSKVKICEAGWAVSFLQGVTVYGPLPLQDQSILAAEIYAVALALRFADVELQELVIDNVLVIENLLSGAVFCLSVARPYAYLWRIVWQASKTEGWSQASWLRQGD